MASTSTVVIPTRETALRQEFLFFDRRQPRAGAERLYVRRTSKGALMKRIAMSLLSVGVAAGVAMAAAPAGAAGPPIGPNQLFDGFVNHHRPEAIILVACPGPIGPGRTGHPLAGQSLSVLPSVDVVGGFTGSRGDAVKAELLLPAASTATGFSVRFNNYGTKAIPVGGTLPCSGKGVVAFVPRPGSKTARADHVVVTFVSPLV
jgi:hypothetical protein